MIISICNQKGGVGKSTLTFNIGHLLAEQGMKTLLVDLDPQASLSVICDKVSEANIYDVMIDGVPLDNAIVCVDENLFLISGGIQLSIVDMQLATTTGRENVLKDVLEPFKGEFDYIIIDCSPSLGLLLINALNTSDSVIIPTSTDYLSYKGLELLLDSVARVKVNMNNKLEILGVVATGHDGRTLHSKEILGLLEEEFEVLGVVGVSTKVKDATVAGEPIHRYDKRHKIASQYREIVRRIAHE